MKCSLTGPVIMLTMLVNLNTQGQFLVVILHIIGQLYQFIFINISSESPENVVYSEQNRLMKIVTVTVLPALCYICYKRPHVISEPAEGNNTILYFSITTESHIFTVLSRIPYTPCSYSGKSCGRKTFADSDGAGPMSRLVTLGIFLRNFSIENLKIRCFRINRNYSVLYYGYNIVRRYFYKSKILRI